MAGSFNHLKKLRRAGLRGRQWRTRWGFWAVIACAALAAVLLLATTSSPDADVLARVNGEEIRTEDLKALQMRHFGHTRPLGEEQELALFEALLAETLLFQQAEREGYALSPEEAEEEIAAQLASRGYTIDDLKAERERRGLSYERYLEDFRREMAIEAYTDATINVTEEEAREYYDDFAQRYPEADLRPFSMVRASIIAELRERALKDLIEELKQDALIEKFT